MERCKRGAARDSGKRSFLRMQRLSLIVGKANPLVCPPHYFHSPTLKPCASLPAMSTVTAIYENGVFRPLGMAQIEQIVGSAGDVKDRLDLPSLEARNQPAGLFCWDSDKFNVSARSFRHHLGHDRQGAVGPGADDQPGSAPWELLVGRERSVSELVAVWLRGLLAPFAHITSVDDDVVLIRSSVDLDRPESEKSHIHYVPPYRSTGEHQHMTRC
mgnify:CR=1 FL=1